MCVCHSWDATVRGVRCVQAPFAYPRERAPGAQHGGERWLPLCVYDSAAGGLPAEHVPCFWGEYYRTHARDPANVAPAPWVLARYK